MSLISEKRILLEKTFASKEEAIREIAKTFVDEEIVEAKDYEVYLESLMERERIAPTAVGYEVGLPHGKSEVVKLPAVAFARLNNEILWDKEEEENIKYVFMLAIPLKASGNEHINILVNLSKKILDDDFREKLIKEKLPTKIAELINE